MTEDNNSLFPQFPNMQVIPQAPTTPPEEPVVIQQVPDEPALIQPIVPFPIIPVTPPEEPVADITPVPMPFAEQAPVPNTTMCYAVDAAGIFIRTAHAFEDPSNPGSFILPSDSSWDAPPTDVPVGSIAVLDFTTRVWGIVEDHRGQTVYDINNCRNSQVITELGPIGAEWTLVAPDADALQYGYHEFDGEAWQINESQRSEIIRWAKDVYDAGTDDKILNGFMYEGKNLKLTAETQRNINACDTIRDEVSYPQPIKMADDTFISLATAEDFHTFYMAGVTYVNTLLQTGWAFKASLADKTTTEIFDIVVALLNQ